MGQPSLAERNIRALGELYPDWVNGLNHFLQIRRQNPHPPSFSFKTLHPDRVLCHTLQSGSPRWIHGPDDPIEQTQRWILPHVNSHTPLIVVWQAGLGYSARLLAGLNDSSRIILCESRWELIWEWICRWDCQWLLHAKRFYWICDEDMESALLNLAQTYPSLFRKGFVLAPGSVLDDPEKERLTTLREKLKQAIHPPSSSVIASEIQNSLIGEKPFFSLMSSTMAEVMPAVLRGAEANGWIAQWPQRPYALSRFMNGLKNWRETLGCIPMIALAFYDSLFSAEELQEMGKAGIARVIWYYDNPHKKLTGHESSSYDLALTFDAHHLEVMRPVFGEKAQVLAAATAFDTFQSSGSFPSPLQPVTYVGATGYRLSLPMLQQNREMAQAILDRIRSIVGDCLGNGPVPMLEQLSALNQSLNPRQIPALFWLMRQLAASEIRKRFLEAALPYGLTIFGDVYWGKNDWVGALMQAFSGTSLLYETQTPELYANSKINLSICHAQVVEGTPFRVYDVLACGGFLLAEYRPALEKEFTIGRDLDVFRTPQELARKIDYYLQNEDLRREIASQGRETVLANHTYKNRISTLMDLLQIPR